jgi:GNAT superfamily N-acetyltransferase
MTDRALRALQRHFGVEINRVVSRPLGVSGVGEGPGQIQYRVLREGEMLRHCADAALELSPRSVRAAFSRGDVCVGAVDGERLVAYQWLAFGATPHVAGIWVQFNPNACYAYRRFVLPAYRGRRIALSLSHHADAPSAARGRNSIVAFINLRNDASWRAAARAGNRTIGYAGYVELGKRFISLCSTGVQRSGFRFYKPAAAAPQAARPATLIAG